MKAFIKLTLLAAFALLPVFAVAATVSAHEGEDHSTEVAQAETEESEEADQPAPSSTYNYTAQAGDSFSLIARKAVQTYGIIRNVNLSTAQIIAAETYLTQSSGSPVLSRGQSVSVEESAVKTAIEKAQGLSAAAQTLWQKYADKANFNTNNVGEVRS